MAEITFKVSVVTSTVSNITFVVDETTFKVTVITFSVVNITFVVTELIFSQICTKMACGTFFQLVNIVNRFLLFFSRLDTLIRSIFPRVHWNPIFSTRLKRPKCFT